MSAVWIAALLGVLAGATTAGTAAGVRASWRRRGRAEAVARASHELRGPLQAAMLGLAAAARPELAADAAVRARLIAVERELARATLALADLEAAHGRAAHGERIEDVDVAALLGSQVEAWRATAQRDGRAIHLLVTGGLPPLRADGRRIAQATGNLIANALEHGAGTVTVRVHEHCGLIRVEVADEGRGLPESVQRLVGRRRGPREARGRGLAIAAEVAERHGGRLAALPAARGCRLALELAGSLARAA